MRPIAGHARCVLAVAGSGQVLLILILIVLALL